MKNWQIEFTKKAAKQIKSLDKSIQSRIKQAVVRKLLDNPNYYLIPLVGDKSGLCKFIVGDYRLLCAKNEDKLIITCVKIKHRKEVYR